MNRFTRYSRISELELCLEQERLAWWGAGVTFLLSLAVAAGSLCLRAPQGDEAGGDRADFTGVHLEWAQAQEAEAEPAEASTFPLSLPPLPPSVEPVLALVAEPPPPPSTPAAEWEAMELEESAPVLALELPEELPPPAPSARRSSAAASALAAPATPAPATPASATPAPASAPQGELVAASYRCTPRPPYPPTMLSRRVQGRVGLRILVDAEGVPRSVELTSSSGHAALDSCAREWVLAHWRFHPALRNGVAVASVVRTHVEFVLR